MLKLERKAKCFLRNHISCTVHLPRILDNHFSNDSFVSGSVLNIVREDGRKDAVKVTWIDHEWQALIAVWTILTS